MTAGMEAAVQVIVLVCMAAIADVAVFVHVHALLHECAIYKVPVLPYVAAPRCKRWRHVPAPVHKPATKHVPIAVQCVPAL